MMHVFWLVRKAASVPLARCAPAWSKNDIHVVVCTVQATCMGREWGMHKVFLSSLTSALRIGIILTQLLPFVTSPEWLKCSLFN